MRDICKLVKSVLFICLFLLLIACHERESTQPVTAARDTSQGNSHRIKSVASSIRTVDFANFDYAPDEGTKWRLRNGRYSPPESHKDEYPVSLAYLSYGDVTADGSEEALVVLFESVKGTAIPYYVFIFTSENGSAKLLWTFETGDRGEGGLRQIMSDQGELVIELYGEGTVIGRNLFGTEQVGACCPKSVTRTRYAWIESRFRLKGEPEVVANESEGAPVLMPKFRLPQ